MENTFSRKRESQLVLQSLPTFGNWKTGNGMTPFSFDHQAYENKTTENPIFDNDVEIENG
jgi:hypothetical protein